MAASTLLLSSTSTRTGSFLAALFTLVACLIALGVARILADAPRSRSWTWTWQPAVPGQLSPGRLEQQVLRAVTRSALLDPSGGQLLPNQVEVLLTPSELRALGPLADQVAENIGHGMVTLARKSRYRLAADPNVVLTAVPHNRRGRPVVHTNFGRPAATLQATSPTRPLGPQRPDKVAAVLRRLEPPGRPLLLGSGHVRLGRRPECDLTVLDPAVSRRHASLYKRIAGWYLVDHGSTNGTFVNGRRIKAPAQLANGDEIQLGSQVRLRFEHSHLRGA
jgi:hypothetical protein